MKSKLIVSCAGSGKTTSLGKEAVSLPSSTNVLITTFTDHNISTIESYCLREKSYLPSNITIKPWYSFEISDCIKPYLPDIIHHEIKGINMQGRASRFAKSNTESYYMDSNGCLYKDRISNLSFKALSDSKTIQRLSELYDVIFIDEIQDLASFDFDLINLLLKNDFTIIMFGDPRQGTFRTSMGPKNQQYQDFFDYCEKTKIEICVDNNTLNRSFRCPDKIIKFASTIFPYYPQSSGTQKTAELFLVPTSKKDSYLNQHPNCVELFDKEAFKKKSDGHRAYNFGLCKGDSFENVLIYPTKPMIDALLNNDFSILSSPQSKAKLYVAITRSKGDVGFVCEDKKVKKFNNPNLVIWDDK